MVPFDRTKTITEESIGALLEQLRECRTKILGLLPVDAILFFQSKATGNFYV